MKEKKQAKAKKLPEFLKKYFWEVDFKKLNIKKNSTYILIRLLEYGDARAIRWMKRHFTREDITDVLFNFRGLSPKSANYWALMLDIDKSRVLCLQKYYLKIQKNHWNSQGSQRSSMRHIWRGKQHVLYN